MSGRNQVGSSLAFIQARMGSSRLPGKVLRNIGGKSILERVIWRLREAESLENVVVLTTTLPEDNAVVAEAKRLGAPVHRGPVTDVLKRYQQAAERFKPDIVVRATADNPLIDMGSVDRIVRALRSSDLDYCMESDLPYGAATEAITSMALQWSDLEAKELDHREHVTLYAKQHPERFRLAFLEPPGVLRRAELRVTVDTPDDFTFMEELIRSLPESSRPIPLEQYLTVAETLVRTRG